MRRNDQSVVKLDNGSNDSFLKVQRNDVEGNRRRGLRGSVCAVGVFGRTGTDIGTDRCGDAAHRPSSASSAAWPAERRSVGRFGRRLLTAAVDTAKQKRNPGFLRVRWVILNPEVTAGGSGLKLQISAT